MVSTEFPFFMCIGAPRSGTTWLYFQLRNHPDIFVPPIKELRHFGNVRGREEIARTFEARKKDDLTQADLRWLEAWRSIGRGDDQEYLRVMRMHDASISGDMSPGYSAMKSAQIAHVRDVVGSGVRVLYILRDPIERDWSQIAFALQRHRKGDPDSAEEHLRFVDQRNGLEEYLRFIDQPKMRRRSDYCRVIRNWTEIFGDVKVIFHDEITKNPQGVLNEVSGFLGVRPQRVIDEDRKVNTVKRGKMPPALAQYLAERHLPMMTELARQYPNPVTDWIKKAEALLALPRLPLPEGWGETKRSRSIWRSSGKAKVRPADRTLFIGIGPAKTGTTWLHSYLRAHPDVFMSPVKELEYFSVNYRADRYGHWNEIFHKRVKETQEKFDAEPKAFRGLILEAMKARVAMIDDPSAYMAYFADAAGPYHKVIGEISPTYIDLEEDGFRAIRGTWPKVRLLCTLRDPVDRLWSEVRSRKQRREDLDPIAEFERELRRPRVPDRKLAMLGNMFSEREFRVEFYETLFTEDAIAGICKWLGVKFETPDFSKRAKPGPVISLPAGIEAKARDHFAPLYDAYKERFGDRLPKSWRL